MAKVSLLLNVEYDPDITKPEDIVFYLNRHLEASRGMYPNSVEKCGKPKLGLLEVLDFIVDGHGRDARVLYAVPDACNAKAVPICVEARRADSGVQLSPLSDAGEDMGNVYLDHYDNQVKAVVTGPGSDDPPAIHTFSNDLDHDRKLVSE